MGIDVATVVRYGAIRGLTPRREASLRLVRRRLASCVFGLFSLALQQRALRDSALLADSAGKCRSRCLRSSILRNWPSGGELHCASRAGPFASLASLSRGSRGDARPRSSCVSVQREKAAPLCCLSPVCCDL